MTEENFYCKFDIYYVDNPRCSWLDERHVMSVTAKSEEDFKIWETAIKQTKCLFIDAASEELSDWACEMHRKRDIDNGVQQFQFSEGV